MDTQQEVISMQGHLTGSNTYAVIYYLILHPDDHQEFYFRNGIFHRDVKPENILVKV